MTQSKNVAEQLWQARLTGTFCDPISEPLSLEQAYSIQNACTQSSDEIVVGYKIGATSNETLEILGLEEPFFGPIYKSALSKNDGTKERLKLPLFTQHKSRVEAEFVVCMKNDFARGKSNADVAVNDILEHIDWIAPGLEIVASRFHEVAGKPGHLAIADFGANQHMVIGQAFSAWRDLDLTSHPVKLAIDNQPDVLGHSGMSIYGNPLAFVCWLLNQPAMHSQGLQTGQIISCGTCTGAPFIDVGDQITADYGALGQLAIEITVNSAN